MTDIISAGVYFYTSPMSITELAAAEGGAAAYVKDYCSHNYPQSSNTANLATLMSHSGIASQIQPFAAEISAAAKQGKSHIVGETNSATQGGGGISPTFGAALWIMDYVMQFLLLGTDVGFLSTLSCLYPHLTMLYQALYFHQGTIGNCESLY